MLQRIGRERHPEDEGPVDEAAETRRPAPRMQHRNSDEEREEQPQERLRRTEVPRLIELGSPPGADEKREHEPEQVQLPPRPEPRQRHNAGVENSVVGEERHVAGVAGHEDRAEESAQGRQDSQARRVLAHRQGGGEADQHEHDAQPDTGGDHIVEVDGREGSEVHDAGAAALQRKRVLPAHVPQAPSNRQQRDTGSRSGTEADLRRKPALLGRIAQEKREAEEEKDDTDPHECVAAEEQRAQGTAPRRPHRWRLRPQDDADNGRGGGEEEEEELVWFHLALRGLRSLGGGAGPRVAPCA